MRESTKRPEALAAIRRRAAALVAAMTLDEKVSQMLHDAPGIPRLGIPAYSWWNEALHGVARAGTATVFPQAIALAATFDPDLVGRVADAASTEARAKHHESVRRGDRSIYKGLTFWSPNVNLFRDPRWGRGHETYGEDPWLTSRLGVAFVRGLQGDDPVRLKAAACAKHFAVHSGPEGERHSFDARVTEKDLWESYLPAFRALVRESRVEAVMGAYNRTNGQPCCGSPRLLGEILRGAWGFEGHVVSDCWALQDFHLSHGVTRTGPESAALAVNSGCDLNCGELFGLLLVAVRDGLVEEAAIDRAVERLMTARLKLGTIGPDPDDPYASIPFAANDTAAHRALSREAAVRSAVLLRNEGELLPLDRTAIRTIAVIGPNADSREVLLGNYHGTPSESVTVLQGIRESAGPGVRVLYAEGCPLWKDRTDENAPAGDGIAEACAAAAAADVAVVCLGLDATIEGEQLATPNGFGDGDRPDLRLPGLQERLLDAVAATGTRVVVVHLSGSASDLRLAEARADAVLQAFYPGAEGGRALASLLFGDASPSGRLPVTFYRATEDLPDYRDYALKGRTYRYLASEPLYPFGFGLGYDRVEYSDAAVADPRPTTGSDVRCSVRATNRGTKPCIETVQLYLEALDAPEPRPRWSLKGVRTLRLDPGGTAVAEFALSPDDLATFDADGARAVRPGRYAAHLGGVQPDDRSAALAGYRPPSVAFELAGEAVPLPR